MRAARARWPAGAAAVLAVAGCSGPDPNLNPVDSGRTAPSIVASRSLPPVTGKWAGLAAKCPDLTGAAARELGVSGAGTPTSQWRDDPGIATYADCHYGSDDGQGKAAGVRVETWRAQAAADAGWQIVANSMTEPLAVGQQGFLWEMPFTAVVAYARSNNVLVTVTIYPADPDHRPATVRALAELKPYAKGVTDDVLDDLVPA